MRVTFKRILFLIFILMAICSLAGCKKGKSSEGCYLQKDLKEEGYIEKIEVTVPEFYRNKKGFTAFNCLNGYNITDIEIDTQVSCGPITALNLLAFYQHLGFDKIPELTPYGTGSDVLFDTYKKIHEFFKTSKETGTIPKDEATGLNQYFDSIGYENVKVDIHEVKSKGSSEFNYEECALYAISEIDEGRPTIVSMVDYFGIGSGHSVIATGYIQYKYEDYTKTYLKIFDFLAEPVPVYIDISKANVSSVISVNLVDCVPSEHDGKVESEETKTDYEYKIGEYVQFGSYDNSPIRWQIINIDTNGNLLLWSDKIISFKAYSATAPEEEFASS